MALSDGTYVKEEEPRRPVAPSRGHDMPSNDPPSSSLLLGASLLQDDQSETKVMSKIQIRDGAEGGSAKTIFGRCSEGCRHVKHALASLAIGLMLISCTVPYIAYELFRDRNAITVVSISTVSARMKIVKTMY